VVELLELEGEVDSLEAAEVVVAEELELDKSVLQAFVESLHSHTPLVRALCLGPPSSLEALYSEYYQINKIQRKTRQDKLKKTYFAVLVSHVLGFFVR
jgi:hypothetical protein